MTANDPAPGGETPAELLTSLARMPLLVREATARIPDPDAPDGPSGGWSVTEVVRHLVAVDAEIWGPRLRQLAEEQHPRWEWTEPDMAGRRPTPIGTALDELGAGRAALVARAAGMDADAWRRTGTHAVFGELDVAGLLREVRKHDLEHVDDLRRRGSAPRPTPGPAAAGPAGA